MLARTSKAELTEKVPQFKKCLGVDWSLSKTKYEESVWYLFGLEIRSASKVIKITSSGHFFGNKNSFVERNKKLPSWIENMVIFISACSSSKWLSESYLFVFQIIVLKKIWNLAVELKAVSVHFLNIFVTRKMRNTPLEIHAKFHIFSNTTVQKTNKYDSESHFEELQANAKITMFSIQEGNFLFLSTNEFLFARTCNLHNFWCRSNFEPEQVPNEIN